MLRPGEAADLADKLGAHALLHGRLPRHFQPRLGPAPAGDPNRSCHRSTILAYELGNTIVSTDLSQLPATREKNSPHG